MVFPVRETGEAASHKPNEIPTCAFFFEAAWNGDMHSRSPRPTSLSWMRIAAYGFLLNMVWEVGQCVFLYDMWKWEFWRATAWMWGAIVGDVGIVLGVAGLARLTVGSLALASMNRLAWTALLALGFAASVLLEWMAQVLHLWGYSALMPTIRILGRTVGLSPIIQITALPALSVAWAAHSRR